MTNELDILGMAVGVLLLGVLILVLLVIIGGAIAHHFDVDHKGNVKFIKDP